MLGPVELAARLLLVAMFTSAVVLHLRQPAHVMDVLAALRLPLITMIPLVVAEAMLAVGLVLYHLAALPAILYVVVVSLPTVAAVVAGRRIPDGPCGCYEGPFGQLVGRQLLWRNGVIATMAVLVAILGSGDVSPGGVLAVAASGCAALVGATLRYRSAIAEMKTFV